MLNNTQLFSYIQTNHLLSMKQVLQLTQHNSFITLHILQPVYLLAIMKIIQELHLVDNQNLLFFPQFHNR